MVISMSPRETSQAASARSSSNRTRSSLRPCFNRNAVPSAANFLCVPVPDSAALGRSLLGKGIKVRVLRQLPGIGDAIRVGVGPWEQMERLVSTLREVLR